MVAERRANRVRRVGKEESGMAVNNVFGVALLRKVRECSEIERGEKTKVVDVHERAVRLGVLKPQENKDDDGRFSNWSENEAGFGISKAQYVWFQGFGLVMVRPRIYKCEPGPKFAPLTEDLSTAQDTKREYWSFAVVLDLFSFFFSGEDCRLDLKKKCSKQFRSVVYIIKAGVLL